MFNHEISSIQVLHRSLLQGSPQLREQRFKVLIGALNSSHCRRTDIPVTYSAAARSKPQPGTSYPAFLWFYSVPPGKCQSGTSN